MTEVEEATDWLVFGEHRFGHPDFPKATKFVRWVKALSNEVEYLENMYGKKENEEERSTQNPESC